MLPHLPRNLLIAALLATGPVARAETQPAGADVFSYNQNSVFHQDDQSRYLDELSAYIYYSNSGSRENFIKQFVPYAEATKPKKDDEFSTTVDTSNPYADTNAAFYDNAKKYYDAGSPFLASISVRLDRYNVENETFITNCTKPFSMINLGNFFTTRNSSTPRDCGGLIITGYLVGKTETFQYLKVPAKLAEKLVAATGSGRTLTIEFICKKGNPPLNEFLAANKGFSRDPKSGMLVNQNAAIIPASIVAYKITGSPEVDALAANIKPTSYERTKTEAAFAERENRRILVDEYNNQYVFYSEGILLAKNANGLSVGSWYVIKNKVFIRLLNDQFGNLTGIPFEFSKNGDLVLDNVVFKDKGAIQGPRPGGQNVAQKTATTGQPKTGEVDTSKDRLNPLTSIIDAFKIAADTKQPVHGKSDNDACFLEITSVDGETFEGIYHDTTSGEPFIYTVKGKATKDTASFTAVDWVKRPASDPESDIAPGSGCNAEFKLGANGVCSGKVKYKTWSRAALTINLVAVNVVTEKPNTTQSATQEPAQTQVMVQIQEDAPPVQVFNVVNNQVNAQVNTQVNIHGVQNVQTVDVVHAAASPQSSSPTNEEVSQEPRSKESQKELFDEALRSESQDQLQTAIEKYKEVIRLDSSTPIALKAMERMDASEKKLSIALEKSRREVDALVDRILP